jgi:hypothetical protein
MIRLKTCRMYKRTGFTSSQSLHLRIQPHSSNWLVISISSMRPQCVSKNGWCRWKSLQMLNVAY